MKGTANPRVMALLDGLLKAPADATARPNAPERGLLDVLRRGLAKANAMDTKVGRDLASRMPAGTTLAQGMVPAYIGGPKRAASVIQNIADSKVGLERAARTLEIGKQRAAELAAIVPHGEMPDLLPAMSRIRTNP